MAQKALITGASSGIGRDMAGVLSDMGYEVILAARSTDKLQELAESLKTKAYVITADLSDRNACLDLYNKTMEIVNEPFQFQ